MKTKDKIVVLALVFIPGALTVAAAYVGYCYVKQKIKKKLDDKKKR